MATADTGLFGPTPYEIQQAQQQALQTAAGNYANQTPLQRAAQGMFTAGGQLGGMGAQALGMVNPQVQQAQQVQDIAKTVDVSSSEGLMQAAARIKDMNPNLAAQLVAKAQAMKAQESQIALQSAHADYWKQGGKPPPLISYNSESGPISFNPADGTYQDAEGNPLSSDDLKKLTLTKSTNRTGADAATHFTSYMSDIGLINQDFRTGKYTRADGTEVPPDKLNSLKLVKIGSQSPNDGQIDVDPKTVDYYANLQQLGDVSWKTGLARSKAGQALILAVEKRMPALASDAGQSPTDIIHARQDLGAQAKAINAFGPAGPNGKIVRSLNTAIQHMDTLEKAGTLLDNSSIPMWNSIANSIAQATGQPAPTDFNAAKQIVASEVVKAVANGNGGALHDRQQAETIFDGKKSPEQMADALRIIRELLGGQLASQEQQYVATTKRPISQLRDQYSQATRDLFTGKGSTQPIAPIARQPSPTVSPQNVPAFSGLDTPQKVRDAIGKTINREQARSILMDMKARGIPIQ